MQNWQGRINRLLIPKTPTNAYSPFGVGVFAYKNQPTNPELWDMTCCKGRRFACKLVNQPFTTNL